MVVKENAKGARLISRGHFVNERLGAVIFGELLSGTIRRGDWLVYGDRRTGIGRVRSVEFMETVKDGISYTALVLESAVPEDVLISAGTDGEVVSVDEFSAHA